MYADDMYFLNHSLKYTYIEYLTKFDYNWLKYIILTEIE